MVNDHPYAEMMQEAISPSRPPIGPATSQSGKSIALQISQADYGMFIQSRTDSRAVTVRAKDEPLRTLARANRTAQATGGKHRNPGGTSLDSSAVLTGVPFTPDSDIGEDNNFRTAELSTQETHLHATRRPARATRAATSARNL